MSDVKLTIKYFGDEARVFESKCLNQILCTCMHHNCETKCCMEPEEARAKLIKYYEARVKNLKEQTIEEFLNDQGIYV